ncbi:stalk domain-containing protein [Paenibacillus kobensis]|uniref:stalk domain-containing protein n=1 Tax=Paenibacillus kobensis TaxID=59841 RepID=UPI000FD96C8D|nr:stalk domain-containing protein [Paenibacillus kobensis]
MYKKFMEKTRYSAIPAALASLLILTAAPSVYAAPAQSVSYAASNSDSGAAVSPAVEDYHIVSVGDSLTVGYTKGLEMQKNPVPYGYVERVYEQALFHGERASVSNYGILGLTTEGLQHYVEAAQKGEQVTPDDLPYGTTKEPRIAQLAAATPQLLADLKAADLVTVTIGSNDFLSVFDQLVKGEADQIVTDMLPVYEQQLEASLRAIIAVNPQAEIVVADLYNPVPNNKLVITEAGYKKLSDASAAVRGKIETVAGKLKGEGYNVQVAYVGNKFVGKELSYTTIISGDFHPNAQGYEAMGQSFAQAVWGDYRTVAQREASVPISVVVAGKELVTANKPVLKNNKTYVPMRDITDAMGADLKWNNATQTATVTLDGKVVAFTIGAKTMTVDGKAVPVETPAYLQKVGKESKTYLPLAALSDGLGFQVVYRGTIKTAFINK